MDSGNKEFSPINGERQWREKGEHLES